MHGLHDWQILIIIISLFQRGTSLAYELRLLPRYISKQRLHRCLARDREAGESDRRATYTCFTVCSITRYVEHNNGQIGQGLCVKHVSRRSSPTCSSEELFLAISMLWKCIRGKTATVAGRKTDEYISPRSESFRYFLLLQQQLFRPHSFSQQHQT